MSSPYYSPASGRWYQMDTLRAPLDPHNANRDVYAANNPINYTDPTGQSLVGCIGGALVVIGGVIVIIGLAASIPASAGVTSPTALELAGTVIATIGAAAVTVGECLE